MDETINNEDKSINAKPWLFKKGNTASVGNGRPKGTFSLKTFAKKYLQDMTDEEKLEFMEGLPKEVIWKMSEGNPENKTDLTSKGEKITLSNEQALAIIARRNTSNTDVI